MITCLDARLSIEEQIALKKSLLAFIQRASEKNASEAEIALLPQIIDALATYF